MPSETSSPPPELLYLLAGDEEEFQAASQDLQPADIVEALNQLPVEGAARIVAALPFERAVHVFDEPELERRGELLARLDESRAVPLLEALASDQQVELFRDLDEAARHRLIHLLDPPTRDALRLLLKYPETSAGGIMTTELVGVPADWTVERGRNYVAAVADVKETVYAIYLLDPASAKLRHVVSLRELLAAEAGEPVARVGPPRKPVSVGPYTDREDVARLISKYNLLAIPVLAAGGHVLGIVTVDDVVDALVKEQTEDVQKFGGMEALDEPYMEIALPQMIRKRAGWLCALFLGEMLTATAMGYFAREIERAVVLAVFLPLIISSGGNSGSQGTSLIIRALALQEVRLRDWWKVAVRELPAGVTLGAILGVIGITRILLWQYAHAHHWPVIGFDYGPHYPLVALTVGVALVGVVTFGSLTGSMLPFLQIGRASCRERV